MLTLKNITKDYLAGDMSVHALRGVSISFRESEFVSVLGPSGCGKTTLLNIIGGLDKYTEGDLIINGRSTKEYGDKDWDTYRNHSIGFVFQTYNLIPHQSVLANVELALTISGVSRAERRERAVRVLEKVGLGDQLYKKPNQMSGGQMQRVAIARALINDPDILLADEPTGALDSETSVQIMELLKEIAQDKLVVMVTHNPDLAERYSTRIVRLLDGEVKGDTDPFDPETVPVKAEETGKKRPSMSFFTALSLSLNNLMTKKARTILTAFAGSIGIIGIALILSLSNGIQTYIDRVQKDTLSSYPLTIEAEAADLGSMVEALSGAHGEAADGAQHELDAVYSNVVMYDLMDSLNTMDVNTNNLKAFKEFIESGDSGLEDYVSAIQYGYDLGFDVYTRDADGKVVKSDVISLLNDMMGSVYGGDFSSYFDTMGDFYSSFEVWQEMLPGEGGSLIDDTVLGQYDVIYGSWPQSYDEVVLIVDKNNEVSDLVLYSLGLRTEEQMADGFEASMSGETLDAEVESWSYEELCGLSFKLIARPEYYVYDEETGGYTDLTATSAGMDYLYDSKDRGISLKISGIVRQNEDAVAGMMTGAIGYTSALTDKVIELSNEADIVKAQLADPGTDAILGLPFATGEEPEPTLDEIKADVDEYIEGLDVSGRAALYTDLTERAPEDYVELTVEQAMQGMTREYIEEMMLEGYAVEMGVDPETIRDYIADMDDETLMDYVSEMTAEAVREQYADAARAQLAAMSAEQLAMALSMSPLTDEQYEYVYAEKLPPKYSESTYEENLELLGYVDKDSPSSISLYAASFADKDEIARIISEYNAAVEDEEDEISYTDYVAILMSSVSTIINAISYVLIAFVAISLVVSSIMIGIITYISVLERTKEIGILRSIGASKRDVSNVFNAETLIEGFAAGVIGIGVTLLLIIPINAIVQNLTGIESLRAILPASGGVALVVISMILTFIAGLIPSGFAARRDPVEALRTE